MAFINQFSYPLFSIGLLLISFFVLKQRLKVRWSITLAVLVGLAGLFLGGFLLLRPNIPTTHNVEDVLSTIQEERPTLIAFFSQYCTGCMAIRPNMDALLGQIEGDYNVAVIDIHTSVGQALRRELGFSFTPEFVLYHAGEELWRDHSVPSVEFLNELAPPCESC
jgi:thiol-disulfide isomerase/thioredoxin